MKRKVEPSTMRIIIGVVVIILCVIIGYNKQYHHVSYPEQGTIDFSGSSDYWYCALNISLGYNSVLFIMPMRDDFTFPSTIVGSVLYDQNVLSEILINYIPDNNNLKALGRFEEKIDAGELSVLTDDILDDYEDYLEMQELWRKYRNRVSIKIQYNDKEFYIPVELNSVMELDMSTI